MPTLSPDDFMYEEWEFDSNPFPSSTINTNIEHINEQVFVDEFDAVRGRLVRDAVVSRRPLGFLWSVPPVPTGEDTGLGKTGTMRRVAWTTNQAWGHDLFSVRQRERLGAEAAAVALYTSFDQQRITSINAVLFQAVVYAADPQHGLNGQSVAARLATRLAAAQGLTDDPEAVIEPINAARASLAPGRPTLRRELVAALAREGTESGSLAEYLASISDASRQRSGSDYFEAFFTLAVAAGVPHVFVFVDQLEDLANSSTPKQKRVKEVERIRDLASEHPVFAGRLHIVFTMHSRAKVAVQGIWSLARLPLFDHQAAITEPYTVTLRGIQTDEQVAELLRTYLPPRPGRVDAIAPFDQSALATLRIVQQGRVGPILDLARAAVDAAASRNVSTIDEAFLRALVGGGTASAVDDVTRRRTAQGRDARMIDDVLT